MTKQSDKPSIDSEAEIWNAIAAFEKILEALPADRVSLQTLADAYEKVGDHTRAKEYLILLANVMIDEADEDGARDIVRKITKFDKNDPQVKDITTRIDKIKPEKVMAEVLDRDRDESLTSRAMNVAAEITFAWNLMQEKKLTQEEYSKVVHDLSENSTRLSDVPVSTLHVLHDMNFSGFNAIMQFVSTSCNTPIISLANFEYQEKTAALIPLDFSVKRGAIVFELIGNDALVAILNPYDDQLSIDIEALTGKISHLFLVAPEDFDNTLEKIRQASPEPESEASDSA